MLEVAKVLGIAPLAVYEVSKSMAVREWKDAEVETEMACLGNTSYPTDKRKGVR